MKNRELTLPWMWEARQQVDLGYSQITISDQVFPQALAGKACFTNSPLTDKEVKSVERASHHSSTASHTHSSQNCRSRSEQPLFSPRFPSATSVLCTLNYLLWRELSLGLYLFPCCVEGLSPFEVGHKWNLSHVS